MQQCHIIINTTAQLFPTKNCGPLVIPTFAVSFLFLVLGIFIYSYFNYKLIYEAPTEQSPLDNVTETCF